MGGPVSGWLDEWMGGWLGGWVGGWRAGGWKCMGVWVCAFATAIYIDSIRLQQLMLS